MDKAQFVEALGLLLTNTCFGVKAARYEDRGPYDEFAVIEFNERPDFRVNITGDSNAMIMSDVLRSLEAYIGY